MKLSKQERIGALIILVIVILALGGWFYVKPKIEAIDSTRKSLASKQQEYDADVETQAKKDPLKAEIVSAYEKGEHLADMFFSEMTSYEADAAFREFLQQCTAKVLVEDLTVGGPTTTTLGTQFYSPSTVTYDLKTYASQGVDVSAAELMRSMRQLLLRTTLGNAQTIGASNVTFTVTAIDRDELIKFVDEINNYEREENGGKIRKAIKINTLSLEYEELNDEYDKILDDLTAQMEADGQNAFQSATGQRPGSSTPTPTPTPTPNPENPENPGENNNQNATPEYYTLTDTMTFYCIEHMQNPKPLLDAQDSSAF